MDSSVWSMGGLILVLVVLSAFFSATETAFSSVNKIRLRHYAEEGNHRAKKALAVAENFDKALSTILIGNNIVNIAASSVATVLATKFFPAAGALISTVFMTILVLTFGEILPKSYAKENSESFALNVAGVLKILMWIFNPIAVIFLKLKEMMTKSGEKSPYVTEQELKYIIETIEEEGVLEEQESELVQSALEFDEVEVQAIITPRVDMVAIDVEDDEETIVNLTLDERFSRMPVYENTIDNIIGILQSRDVLEHVIRKKPINIKHMIGDCIFVHKTMKISSLLAEFKKKKIHMAIVTDDYGGTMGIVSMEDILEQLVGDIWDEDDEIIHDFIKLESDIYEVSGDINIYEMFEQLEYENRSFETDYNTLGGWALEMFEHIPEIGESFVFDNLEITVKELDDQRITKLIVKVLKNEETEGK